MVQSYETRGRTAVANIAAKQPHELLLQLGGALAILLSVVLFGIHWLPGQTAIRASDLPSATTTLILDIILGAALMISGVIVRKNVVNGAIVAAVVSVILFAFGNQAGTNPGVGTIAGVVGILGAILAAASPYMPAKGRD